MTFNSETFELSRDGQPLAPRPKTAELLLFLLENRDRVLSKNEIFDAVWKDTVVGDKSLVQAIGELRLLLDDSPKEPRFIKTFPKRGYGWIHALSCNEQQEADPLTRREPSKTRRGYIPLLGLALLIALVWFVRERAQLVEGPSFPLKLAILPFENETGDPTLGWVELGLADMLSENLYRVEGLEVVSMLATYSELASSPDIETRELLARTGAGYGLEVRIEKVLDGYSLVYQLSKRSGDVHFETMVVKDLQGAMIPLAERIRKRLVPDSRRLNIGSSNEEANRDYARGIRTLEEIGVPLAATYFEAALHRDPHFTAARVRLAETEAARGNWVNSVVLYQKALDEALEAGLTIQAVEAQFGLAQSLFQLGRLSTVASLLEAGTLQAAENDDQLGQAVGLRLQGRLQEELGFPQNRRALYAQALQITSDLQDPNIRAGNLFHLGSWNEPGGDLEKNRELLQLSLSYFKELGKRWDVAGTQMTLGMNLSLPAQQRFAYLQASHATLVQLEHATGVLRAHMFLGIFFLERRDGDQAVYHFKKAIEMASAHGARLNEAKLAYQLALAHIYRFLTRPDSDQDLVHARVFLNRSRSQFQEINLPMRVAGSSLIFGLITQMEGDLPAAVTQMQDSIVQLDGIQHEEPRAMARVALAMAYMEGKQWAQALPLFAAARDISSRGSVMILAYKARCFYELGRDAEALAAMNEARTKAGLRWSDEEQKRLEIYHLAHDGGTRPQLPPEPGFMVAYWDIR